jgi:hypothetical protein
MGMSARLLILSLALAAAQVLYGQKSNERAAWRALSDYEESAKEARANADFLAKAKEKIDEADANPETHNRTKTQTYKFRIYYHLFRQNLDKENKKLEASVPDKNERLVTAYGNTSLAEFETAARTLDTIRQKDSKYLDKINTALSNGNSALEEDDLRFSLAVQQMKLESGNIASGKWKAKQYDQAADYYYKTAIMNSVLQQAKDTANFYNACVAAGRSGDAGRITSYNKAMIDAGIGIPYNYESLYNLSMQQKDTAKAMEVLQKGRAFFPSEGGLLNLETNLFLASNRQQEALRNLKQSLEREPNNALYYFVIGNIYDNMANPKDKASGKDLEKPGNFEELFKNAETNYLRAIELNPANQEYLYNSYYNLGAMYNNYGGYISAKPTKDIKQQKENESKAQIYYQKSIPHLEKALALRKDDRTTMVALRKLYLLTRNEAKAKEMGDRLKAVE